MTFEENISKENENLENFNEERKNESGLDLSRIDEVMEILEELLDEIPDQYLNNLNGGVILEEEVNYHPEGNDLIVLGSYKIDNLGRQIVIYYGSFMKLYFYLDRESLKERLRETLRHELRHHLEFLAGNNDLVIEDENFIENYKKGRDVEWKK